MTERSNLSDKGDLRDRGGGLNGRLNEFAAEGSGRSAVSGVDERAQQVVAIAIVLQGCSTVSICC